MKVDEFNTKFQKCGGEPSLSPRALMPLLLAFPRIIHGGLGWLLRALRISIFLSAILRTGREVDFADFVLFRASASLCNSGSRFWSMDAAG